METQNEKNQENTQKNIKPDQRPQGPRTTADRSPEKKPDGPRPYRPKGPGSQGPSSRSSSGPKGKSDKPYDKRDRKMQFRRKFCKFCRDSKLPINFKSHDLLRRHTTEDGKIIPRRITGLCAKHQRQLAREIKRARNIALLPFSKM